MFDTGEEGVGREVFQEEENMAGHSISRRSFVATTGALAGLSAAAGGLRAAGPMFCAEEAHAAPADTIAWSQCNVNCGGNCIFQWHVRDGKVAYMETDTVGDADFQARACLRGRSMRRWLNHPDRQIGRAHV